MPNFSLKDQVVFEAAQKFETPFHLYDERGIRRTARALRDAFGEIEDFREYFAVKALPTPAILRILKEEGCGVDCASVTELMLADACGLSGRGHHVQRQRRDRGGIRPRPAAGRVYQPG